METLFGHLRVSLSGVIHGNCWPVQVVWSNARGEWSHPASRNRDRGLRFGVGSGVGSLSEVRNEAPLVRNAKQERERITRLADVDADLSCVRERRRPFVNVVRPERLRFLPSGPVQLSPSRVKLGDELAYDERPHRIEECGVIVPWVRSAIARSSDGKRALTALNERKDCYSFPLIAFRVLEGFQVVRSRSNNHPPPPPPGSPRALG